jgi:ribosome maturation factor RimP
MTSPAQTIDELIRPLVTDAGLELWDVEVNPRLVRILVDREGGIDLEALTGLARTVSAVLDTREDLTPGAHYELEVSSPGVERTLRVPRHFQRYIGATVAVKTTAAGGAPSRRLQGVLRSAEDAGITIDSDEGAQALSYEQIHKARVVLLWGPTATGGGAPSKARGASGAKRAPTPAATKAGAERIKDVAR